MSNPNITRETVLHACGHWIDIPIAVDPEKRQWTIEDTAANGLCDECFTERLHSGQIDRRLF